MKGLIKRLFAFAIVVVLVLSLIPVSATSEESSGCPLSSGELGLLKMLGIPVETTDFERGFTRGELAVAVAKLMKIEGNTAFESSPFTDVPTNHEYYPYICALVQAGVFSGDGDGRFRVDDVVQFNEICKVLTIPLGYKNYGEMTSYFKAARLSGIIDGVNQDTNVSVGTAYELLYNTLHASMFEPYSFGEDVEYKINTDQTALKQFHNLVKMEGIVDGVYGTTLTSASDSIEKEQITIDGKRYNYSNGKDLLGYSVVFYLKANDKSFRPQIQYVYTNENKNKTFVVESDAIISKNGTNFKYYNEKGAVLQLEVSPYVCVIYNGVANSSISDAEYVPESGEVAFIDNDGDRKYDVVKVTSYEYAVVKSVNAEEQIIYTRYPDGMIIGNEPGRKFETEFKVDGFEAHFMALKPETIIVYQLSNNPYGTIHNKLEILTNPISGQITSLANDSIAIGGKNYPLAKNCVTDVAVKGDLELGQSITAYKHNGKIVTILHQTTDGFEIGYLVDASEVNRGFSPKIMFKVLCSDGSLNVIDGADKLTIDGVKVDSKNVLGLLATTNDVTHQPQDEDPACTLMYTQLIKYKLDKDGKIYALDTPHYNEGMEPETSLQLTHSYGVRRYFGSSRSFNTSIDDENYQYDFYSGSDTITWRIPMHRREEASLYRTSLYIGGSESSYYIEGYNVDENGKAGIILSYQRENIDVNSVGDFSEHLTYIVSDIYSAVNAEGEVHKYLSLVGSGTENINLGSEYENADIQKGDVIKYDLFDGTVYKLHSMFGVDDCATKFASPDSRVFESVSSADGSKIGRLRYSRMVYGTIMDIDDGMIFHTTTVPKDGVNMKQRSNLANFAGYVNSGRVYIYDKNSRTGNIEMGTVDDIITYKINPLNPDKVVMGMSGGTLQYIYVLRGWE